MTELRLTAPRAPVGATRAVAFAAALLVAVTGGALATWLALDPSLALADKGSSSGDGGDDG
ncbi:MAG: hypothetical protein ACREER_11210, partial [Alphaproteobacteria bacterium]